MIPHPANIFSFVLSQLVSSYKLLLSLPSPLFLHVSFSSVTNLFTPSLMPHLSSQAVRNGSIQRFNEVVAKYGPAFKADKNHTLVLRLGHNVLKTGEGITLLRYFVSSYF